jgi:spermidine synthase
VAELIPEVVEWNRGPLGAFSGRPLDDPRTRVYLGDVVKLLKKSRASFDVIALDVDNGPEGLTRNSNNWLYTLSDCRGQEALRPGGILAYWSAGPDRFYDKRRCGLMVEAGCMRMAARAHGISLMASGCEPPA